MSTVRLGFHYVGIFAQWALIVLALFLLIGSTATQDYLAGIAFIILALFLRVRTIWAEYRMNDTEVKGPDIKVVVERYPKECDHEWGPPDWHDRVRMCMKCGYVEDLDA